MRRHLSLKQIGPVIGVKETHVPQAIDPAVDKIAALFNTYPRETLAWVMERAAELLEAEIAARESMLNGRYSPASTPNSVARPAGDSGRASHRATPNGR